MVNAIYHLLMKIKIIRNYDKHDHNRSDHKIIEQLFTAISCGDKRHAVIYHVDQYVTHQEEVGQRRARNPLLILHGWMENEEATNQQLKR